MIFFLIISRANSQECLPPGDCSNYCRVTYSGSKSFYNQTDHLCYPTVKCDSTSFYDSSSNSCYSQSEVPSTPTNSSSSNTTDSNTTSSRNTVCIHGITKNGICICNSGYYTSTIQDPSSSVIELCNDTHPPSSNYSIGSNGELYLNSQKRDPAMQVPLSPLYKFLILLAFALSLCIFSCCYVKRLKSSSYS